MGEIEAFRWDVLFLKLRHRCNVLGVYHDTISESRIRRDWDGLEREYIVCIDSYRYNISIGFDPRIGTSGLDRVQRTATRCKVSTANHAEKRLTVGDQVDCWRPRKDLSYISVDRGFCGRPLCTLAHVYSCSATGCVQLTTPAKQFSSVFSDGDSHLMVIGGYFTMSGVLSTFAIICIQLGGASSTDTFIVRGVFAFLAAICAFLVTEAALMELTAELFMENVVPLAVPYVLEFILFAFQISFLSVLKDAFDHGKLDYMDMGFGLSCSLLLCSFALFVIVY